MQRNAYSTALGQGASMDCSKVWVRVTALFDRTGSRTLHRPGVATDGGRLGFQRRLRLNFEEQETARERLGYGEQVEKIEKGFQHWLVGWRLRFGTAIGGLQQRREVGEQPECGNVGCTTAPLLTFRPPQCNTAPNSHDTC